MTPDPRPSTPPPTARASAVDVVAIGDATLVRVAGLVDERFIGFGDVGTTRSVVIDVSGMTRMTSFGVRQWLKAMDALPKTITDLYLLGCPTFFVDQLNMVLKFGGTGKVLTVTAPHSCPSCGVESGELIDVLAERGTLSTGGVPPKVCARCGGALELDETPESYFAFVAKYGATSVAPAAAELLSANGLYTTLATAAERPPRIIKLVRGSVTYFRIIGTIGSMFRARPVLVGAEGEVVIDLAEVDRYEIAGQKEWRRLLKSLSGQVPAVTLVDVGEPFLRTAGDTLGIAKNIAVASVLVPYGCIECFRTSFESVNATWPLRFGARVCAVCGGSSGNRISEDSLLPLKTAGAEPPPESLKVISQRDEILAQAMVDASAAPAGDAATPAVGSDDTILGKYKIVRRLSAGGMVEVFLAKQVGIGGFEKPVVLKRIQRKLMERRNDAIELFLNEAKVAGRLAHPNIVQVLDVGEVQGALYLAMEYVHGKDLRNVINRLQQAPSLLPLGEAIYIAREVALALHHAYWTTDMMGDRLAVVHRDVSPQNIVLGYDGSVKLLDFGVAMSAVTEHPDSMVVGKWLYMSPEAITREPTDHRSDLFSLGVVLYLMCSSYMPFSGKEPNEIVTKIRSGFYKPLQELVSVPDRLATLVARLLAPNPDDRPQRGQDVAAELTDIARQYGLDRSGTNIAQVLTHLFPNDGHAMFELPVTLVRELPTDGAAPGGPASGASGESADLGHDETLLSAGAPPHPGPHRGHQPPQRRPAPSATVPLSMQSPAPPGPTLPPGQGRGHQAPLRVMPLPPVARRQTRPPFSAVSALVIAGVALVIIVAMYLLVRPT